MLIGRLSAMRLMLLRHAKSDWPNGVADKDRPLGPRGRHDAPHMGEEMARRGLVPDLAMISTAQRARETWSFVRPFFPNVREHFERRIYDASTAEILEVIRDVGSDVGTLLLVGHNPSLELLASQLIGRGSERLRGKLGEKFPTCALAVIDFGNPDWCSVATGRLSLFLTPADIE
jgi:phosphohistidine phosphatase